jgi:hypothetical protein
MPDNVLHACQTTYCYACLMTKYMHARHFQCMAGSEARHTSCRSTLARRTVTQHVAEYAVLGYCLALRKLPEGLQTQAGLTDNCGLCYVLSLSVSFREFSPGFSIHIVLIVCSKDVSKHRANKQPLW